MFFSIGSHFGGGRRELGCREMKKKKEIEKIGLKGKFVFSSMGIFNWVYREIDGV